MANIEIANNTTIAGVYDTTLQSPTGGAAGAVTVNATEDVAIKEIAGALAIGASGGGVGVGAAANVIVFKSQTIAESRNSNLNSSGAINVGALSTKEVLSYAVTAGIGGSVGIGATVGVIIIGTNTADPDTQGQQTGQLNQGNNGTIASVNNGTNSSHGSNAVASGTAGNPNNANVTSTYDVSSVLTGGNDGVTAQIAGGNVTGIAGQCRRHQRQRGQDVPARRRLRQECRHRRRHRLHQRQQQRARQSERDRRRALRHRPGSRQGRHHRTLCRQDHRHRGDRRRCGALLRRRLRRWRSAMSPTP